MRTTTTTGRRRRRTSAVFGVILASSVVLSAEADVQRTASDASDVSLVSDTKRHVSEKPNLRSLTETETETETISSDTPDLALDLGLDTNTVANTNEEFFVELAEDPLVDHPDLNIKACLEKDDGTTICSKNRAQAEWMKWPLESVQGLPIISNLCVENSNNWPIALNKARKQWNKKSRGAVQLKYRQAQCDTRQNAQLTHIPNAIHVVYGSCGPDCCGKADVEYKVSAFCCCKRICMLNHCFWCFFIPCVSNPTHLLLTYHTSSQYRINAEGQRVVTQYSALVRVDKTCHGTKSPMYNLQYILCHELGHAIGLAHDYGVGSCMGEFSDGKKPGKGDVKSLLKMYGDNISVAPAKL